MPFRHSGNDFENVENSAAGLCASLAACSFALQSERKQRTKIVRCFAKPRYILSVSSRNHFYCKAPLCHHYCKAALHNCRASLLHNFCVTQFNQLVFHALHGGKITNRHKLSSSYYKTMPYIIKYYSDMANLPSLASTHAEYSTPTLKQPTLFFKYVCLASSNFFCKACLTAALFETFTFSQKASKL